MVILLTFVIDLFSFLCPETGMILLSYLINYTIQLIFYTFLCFCTLRRQRLKYNPRSRKLIPYNQ